MLYDYLQVYKYIHLYNVLIARAEGGGEMNHCLENMKIKNNVL